MDFEDSQRLRDAKISLIALLGFFTFAASLAPWCMKRLFSRTPLDALNVVTAFAAGIVFGTLMMHMIPEGSEEFEHYLEGAYAVYHDEGNSTRRLAGFGPRLLEQEHEPNPHEALIHFPWCTLVIGLTALVLVAIDRTIVAHGMHGDGAGGHHDDHDHDHVSAAFVAMQKQAAAEEASAKGKPLVAGGTTAYGMVARAVVGEQPPEGGTVAADCCAPADKTAVVVQHQCDVNAVAVTTKAAKREAAMKAWVFFVALSIHSVMDGLSLGAEHELKHFYAILVAVLAHKAFDGIALGVPVYLAQMPPLQTWGSLLFCAFMTPLGIGIGWGATAAVSGTQATLAKAVITSISAGSFLYISIMELLPASLHDGRRLPLKLFAFLVGFVVMGILAGFIVH